jgi:hypothetical protein
LPLLLLVVALHLLLLLCALRVLLLVALQQCPWEQVLQLRLPKAACCGLGQAESVQA